MSRKAILIEASRIKNHDDLPGARVDVDNFKTFLESAIGGAWESNEIQILSHPSKSTLNAALKLASISDYTFVTFSGHGEHVKGKGIDETRLCINDYEEVAAYDLNPGSKWSLVIADACRKVRYIEAEERAQAFQRSLEGKMAKLRPNRQRCRHLFDMSISAADRGPIYFYSCDLNEGAQESATQGGYFSRALVDVAEAWSDEVPAHRTPAVLRSNQAFTAAANVTTNKNRQQHPQSEAGRRQVHFPFSVLAY